MRANTFIVGCPEEIRGVKEGRLLVGIVFRNDDSCRSRKDSISSREQAHTIAISNLEERIPSQFNAMAVETK